jgi:hypothetical protein
MCIAAAVAGAGLAGAGISAMGAKSAANTQADAANNAAQMQMQQFQQLQQNLQPYMNIGTDYLPQLNNQLQNMYGSSFNFDPTESQLQNTPGYQFTLQQGLKNTNNALAAKGLNLSGAQAKGLAQFTTGLADQTYQQQYQNALQSFMTNYGVASDQYNRLAGLVGLGENASAGVGNAGLNAANTAGNYLTSGANASAAGTVGATSALSGGLNTAGQSGLLYSLMNNGGGFGSQSGGIYGSPTQGVAGWTPAGS